jgi:hypothetical protein
MQIVVSSNELWIVRRGFLFECGQATIAAM